MVLHNFPVICVTFSSHVEETETLLLTHLRLLLHTRLFDVLTSQPDSQRLSSTCDEFGINLVSYQ